MAMRPAVPGRLMTFWPLVGALYFMVSGGPYGLEDLAQSTGFGWAIVVLLVVPLVWSVPTALMVGELAAAIPVDGGYYVWVRRALGPFWGFQEAWLSLAASAFDMAIYPTLFSLYVVRLAPGLAPWSIVISTGVIAVAAAYNLAGARAVGEGSAAMTALLLGPFLILSVMAVLRHAPVGPAATIVGPRSGLATGVVVAMWNYMGWDNASTMAGEVARPQRNYPLAVGTSVALVAVSYVVPMAAMRVAHVDPSSWSTGAWVDVARDCGGVALAIAVVVGGAVSAFGMYNALCLSYSRLPAALARDGLLPRVFALENRAGTPWVSVLVCSAMWALSLGLSFERLVSLDIVLYGASLLLEFVALAVLRVRQPDLPRPFRVPGGLPVAATLGLGPLVLLGFALLENANERVLGMSALLFASAVAAVGPFVYALTVATRPVSSESS
jgi:amino acid transporter